MNFYILPPFSKIFDILYMLLIKGQDLDDSISTAL